MVVKASLKLYYVGVVQQLMNGNFILQTTIHGAVLATPLDDFHGLLNHMPYQLLMSLAVPNAKYMGISPSV